MTLSVDRKALIGFVRSIHALADEGIVTHRDGALHCSAADPGHVCLIEATLPCEGEPSDDCEVGWDFQKAADSLPKVFSKSERVNVEWNGSRVKFHADGRLRRLPNLDTSTMPRPKRPSAEKVDALLKTTVRLDDWSEAVAFTKAAEPISDIVILNADSDGFALSCDGDTDGLAFAISAAVDGPPARVLLSHDYFQSIVQSMSGPGVIHLATDYPTKFVTAAADILLAPRLEST